MKRYDSYKDSGVEWIGEIPNNWELKQLKHISNFQNGYGFKSDKWTGSGIPIIRIQNLNGGERFNFYEEDIQLERYLVSEGDLLFSWSGNVGTSFGPFMWSKSGNYYLNQHIFLFNQKVEVNLKWYFYTLKRLTRFIERYFTTGVIGLVHITKDELGGSKIPYPSISEQQQIVSFLDTKTSLIDSLIDKTQRKIELLKEKRTSLINEVVTKGLNPNVEMKDSGVKWIGEIPNNWTNSCVRYVTHEHRQGYYSSDSYSENGIRVVRITDLNDDRTISIEKSPFYQLSEEEKERFILRNGDFLFPRTGGVGRFGIFNDTTPSIYGSFLIRFRFYDSVINQYMRYYFDSGIYLNQILSEIHGGVNQNVHVENIKDCKIFYPNKSEQQQIVEYLDTQTGLIDKTISVEEKRIELLKEYRQSLISEVVTGKRKVV